jgi:AraC-like DNA-binding protein
MRIERASRTDEILREVAERLTDYRLNRNESLETVARNAGLSERTVRSAMTTGRMSTTTLVRLLRALDQLQNVDAFLPPVGPSPLRLARLNTRPRERASARRPRERE